jgi:toxin HigB-1
MKIAWTPISIEQTLQQMVDEIYHPSLKTHKLTGDLDNTWSCSIDYSYRILFEFVTDPETGEQAVLLLNMGSHDDVY